LYIALLIYFKLNYLVFNKIMDRFMIWRNIRNIREYLRIIRG